MPDSRGITNLQCRGTSCRGRHFGRRISDIAMLFAQCGSEKVAISCSRHDRLKWKEGVAEWPYGLSGQRILQHPSWSWTIQESPASFRYLINRYIDGNVGRSMNRPTLENDGFYWQASINDILHYPPDSSL